ncbi:MAG: DsbA family oxidoreductase [Bacteroidota bacterium]
MKGLDDLSSARSTVDRSEEAGAVAITYYTDPLCCWSWALEPHWRRLRYTFRDQITWHYRMGGLIADWASFSDPLQAIVRPAQMGPLWMQACELSAMPMCDTIWVDDPPATSYAACLAVKAAECQSGLAGERYLRRLREAVMVDGRNIARWETLLEVARQLDHDMPETFSVESFEKELHAKEATQAFRDDLSEARYRNITRFPTLIFRKRTGEGLMIVGFRPYEAMESVLLQLAPDLRPDRVPPTTDAYSSFWGGTVEPELAWLTDRHEGKE